MLTCSTRVESVELYLISIISPAFMSLMESWVELSLPPLTILAVEGMVMVLLSPVN